MKMKPMPRRTLGGVVMCLLAAGCSTTEPEGFRPLFDGGDLDGWVQVLDSDWVVEDGVLSSAQDPNGRLAGESWLLTEGDYEDFVLELEYRITPGGNSGVFLRDPLPRRQRLAAEDGGQPPPWDAGYEVNINNDHPEYPTGSIWAVAGAPANLQREGEWNELEIRVEGERIWTWVNGVPALVGAELPPRSTSGAIGLQRHGGAAFREKLIEFRNIRIRPL